MRVFLYVISVVVFYVVYCGFDRPLRVCSRLDCVLFFLVVPLFTVFYLLCERSRGAIRKGVASGAGGERKKRGNRRREGAAKCTVYQYVVLS